MMKKTVTKEFTWDCAHKLYNSCLSKKANEDEYGLCSNIHGHTYKMFVTVSSELDKLENGMIINFKDLKRIVKEKIVDELDHALILTYGDPLINKLNDEGIKLVVVGYESTCENQIVDMWNFLEPVLRLHGCILEEIKLYETPTSYATLSKTKDL